jgi:hypothetical protein
MATLLEDPNEHYRLSFVEMLDMSITMCMFYLLEFSLRSTLYRTHSTFFVKSCQVFAFIKVGSIHKMCMLCLVQYLHKTH